MRRGSSPGAQRRWRSDIRAPTWNILVRFGVSLFLTKERTSSSPIDAVLAFQAGAAAGRAEMRRRPPGGRGRGVWRRATGREREGRVEERR